MGHRTAASRSLVCVFRSWCRTLRARVMNGWLLLCTPDDRGEKGGRRSAPHARAPLDRVISARKQSAERIAPTSPLTKRDAPKRREPLRGLDARRQRPSVASHKTMRQRREEQTKTPTRRGEKRSFREQTRMPRSPAKNKSPMRAYLHQDILNRFHGIRIDHVRSRAPRRGQIPERGLR